MEDSNSVSLKEEATTWLLRELEKGVQSLRNDGGLSIEEAFDGLLQNDFNG